MKQKTISVLGATGSIGTQTLDMISRYPQRFSATCLTAYSSCEKLFELVRRFRPLTAGLVVEPEFIPEDVRFCEWFFGADCSTRALRAAKSNAALCAITGIAGLDTVMTALDICDEVLLANKEALVTGGDLVTEKARRLNKPLLPVDSEHSAIFQCLRGAEGNKLSKIFLTASGGPFRTWTKEQLEGATKAQALNHPTWNMGSKITIDSASMFNKALEIIEAKWLFNVEPEQIEVVVHPQSIVHSMIAFEDGAVLAQLGVPDMRVPILYAMTFPERIESAVPTPDFAALGALTFEKGDPVRFPALRLAYEALHEGGAACCMLNAANEVAVEAFLNDKIPFGVISRTVQETLNRVGHQPLTNLSDVYAADALARKTAREFLAEDMK